MKPTPAAVLILLTAAACQGGAAIGSPAPAPAVFVAVDPVPLIGSPGGAEAALQALEIQPAALEGRQLATVTAWGRFAPAPWPLKVRAYFGDAGVLLDDRSSTLEGGGGAPSRWRVAYRVILGAAPAYEATTLRTPYQATTSAAGALVLDASRGLVVRFTGADPSGQAGLIVQEGMTVELR